MSSQIEVSHSMAIKSTGFGSGKSFVMQKTIALHLEFMNKEKNGFVMEDLYSENPYIKKGYIKQLKQCADILEVDYTPLKYSEEQALLIQFNNIKLDPKSIIK